MNDKIKKIIVLSIIFVIFITLMIIAFIKNHNNKPIEESTIEIEYAQNDSNPNVMDSTTEELTEESFNTTLPVEYTSADGSLHYSNYDLLTIDQANSISDLNDIVQTRNKNKLTHTTIKDINIKSNKIFEKDQKFDIIDATITYGTDETEDIVIIYNSDTKDFVRYEKASDYYKNVVTYYDDEEEFAE